MDLEKQIRQWRKALHVQGKFEDGHLEELESHLRDHIEHLINKGFSEEDAFEEAKKQMGEPALLGEENYKTAQRQHWGILKTVMPALLANYFKIGLRQFNRHKLYAWINVGGLSLGLVCFLLISYYVIHEYSYDRQYSEKSIFRIATQEVAPDGSLEIDAGGPVPLGTVLKEELPEVKESVRFWRSFLPSLKVGDQVFEESKFLFADPLVLDVFDFELREGNPKTALVGPNKIVVSESMAMKYFGSYDVVGKSLEYKGYPGNDMTFSISAVFKDLPSTTHFSFDFLASFETLEDKWTSNWGSFKPVWTYVQLNEGTSPHAFEDKLQAIPLKYFPDRLHEGEDFKLILEPISDIYLYSKAGRPMKAGGSLALISILAAIGILILAMCCVNFINISLARAMTRQKEIGVRKVLGAVRGNLMGQFLMEVMVTFLFALAVAILFCFFLRHAFESFAGFSIETTTIFSPAYLGVLAAVFVLLILLAGGYPSMILAGFNTLAALSERVFNRPGTSISMRKGLILFQCIISSILIIGILGINDQLTYIKNKSTGVDMDRIVVIPYSDQPEVFENKLSNIPGVIDFGYSQQLPVNDLNYDGRIVNKPGSEEVLQLQSCFVSANFIDLYDITLLAGQRFNPDAHSEINRFIINETAAQALGWDSETAIGKELVWSGSMKGEVIGVIQDFHLNSVHEVIPPLIMLPAYNRDEYWNNLYISVKLESNALTPALADIETEWRSINHSRPYHYFFLEDSYRDLHVQDFRFGQLILIFTGVAIAISSLGLFALSAYTAERRRKEIGVRKVLGSTVAQIFYKIGAPFLLITLLAVLLAMPITLWGLNQWLDTFAYHTAPHPLSFFIGFVIVLVITLLSILKETLRASFINPVKLLREE